MAQHSDTKDAQPLHFGKLPTNTNDIYKTFFFAARKHGVFVIIVYYVI